jgi:type I restriction enzyme M protein
MAVAGFSNEYQLQRIVQRCHNVLWERHGLDPAQAFDEFSKLVFVKLFAEARGLSAAPLVVDESRGDGADRIRRLFAEAQAAPGFRGIFTADTIVADGPAIAQVLALLEPYSLRETVSGVGGIDVKGTIYENMIGNTFRGELGQFFTHRSIVEFMVRLVGLDENSVVYDPACGSGGFLIMCAKLLREQLRKESQGLWEPALRRRLVDFGAHHLIGTEINERTARVARLNLLMHGLHHDNVFNVNALRTEESDEEEVRRKLGEESVDLVFANPPFAGYEKDPSVLSRFELGRYGATTREVLFIERIIKVLKPEGMAGVVVPQGIFSNRKLARVRDYIRRHTRLVAVIELPDWAFQPSGTSVRGSLLFLQRVKAVPSSYRVFMKKVWEIGFDSTGRPTERNDFPSTITEFKAGDARYLVPIEDLEDRLDAKLFDPRHRRAIERLRRNPRHELVRLSDVGCFEVERVNPRLLPGARFQVIETGCVDPTTLRITPKYVLGRASNYTSLKRVRSQDILISRRRAYRGAIVRVPPELNGALAISEFSVLRLKQGFDSDFVLEILRSPEFLEVMSIYSTGEMSGRIAERDLAALRIPIPSRQRQLGSALREHREEIARLETRIAKERQAIQALCTEVIGGVDES